MRCYLETGRDLRLSSGRQDFEQSLHEAATAENGNGRIKDNGED